MQLQDSRGVLYKEPCFFVRAIIQSIKILHFYSFIVTGQFLVTTELQIGDLFLYYDNLSYLFLFNLILALFCDKCAVLNSTMYECYDVYIVFVKRLEAEQNKSKVIKLIKYE